MDKDIKPESLKLHCLACLEKLADYKHDLEETPHLLLQLFKKCTGFKKTENELFPNSICENCFGKFKNFDEFLEMSTKSNQFLQDLLKSYRKIPNELIPIEVEEAYQEEDSENFFLKPEVFLNTDPLNNENSEQEENTIKEVFVKKEIETEDIKILETKELEIKPNVNKSKRDLQKDSKPNLNCKICLKTYASPSSLNVHMRTHLEKRPFQCEKCERGFNKKFRLSEHMNKFHSKNSTEIVCKYGCKHTFKTVEAAENHYSENHPSNTTFEPDSLNSDDSQMETNTKSITKGPEVQSKVFQHLPIKIENLPAINKLYICTICIKNYSSSTALRIHKRIHDEKRPFQCDKCERGFNAKARLKSHMEEDHAEKPVEIPCKYGCGKTFQRKHTALAHYRLKHILPEQGIAPKDYSCICEECGKVCKNKYFLNEHRFQHVPYDELPYRCEPCNRRFRSKKHMKRHLVRHEPVRKYECPHCGLRKATRQELRKHINNHTKEILYPCPICGKNFTTSENMRRHKRVVHLGVKNYKCRFCEESFGKAETRKHHEMRHTGERPHKCQICEKSFIQLVALKAHMKTHNKTGRLNQENIILESQMPQTNTSLGLNESCVLNTSNNNFTLVLPTHNENLQ